MVKRGAKMAQKCLKKIKKVRIDKKVKEWTKMVKNGVKIDKNG